MQGDPDFQSELTDADFDPHLNTVRAVTVIGIIFGTLGLCSIPLGLSYFHAGSGMGDFEIRLWDRGVNSTSMDSLWFLLSTLAGSGLASLLLCSSIVAKQFNPVGRVGLLAFAVGSLLLSLAGSFFYLRWVLPRWRDAAAAQVRGTIPPYAILIAWVVGTILSFAIISVFSYVGVKSAYSQEQT